VFTHEILYKKRLLVFITNEEFKLRHRQLGFQDLKEKMSKKKRKESKHLPLKEATGT
jgi:hypothetical protein